MSKPLAGLKVLDFSSLLPGPYASMMLTDMGAEVLRIVSPHHNDMLDSVEPRLTLAEQSHSYAYLSINRNKQDWILDLKQPASITAIKQRVTEYDIIIEQFRPGVMAKLGLDYASLTTLNPGLIYCSITGFGQTGPYKDRAGHDINYLALSGLASYSGTEQSGPVLSGTQIADIAGGSHQAVIAILAAVHARHNTGQGQHLDISMTDAAFGLNAMYGAGALGSGEDPKPGGTLLNGGSFYGYYQTKDRRYLSVGCLEPKFVKGFIEVMAQPSWWGLYQAGDFDKLKQAIATEIAKQSLSHWQQKFATVDVCVEPVLTVTEAANSPLIKARNMVSENQIEIAQQHKTIKQIASVVKFDQ